MKMSEMTPSKPLRARQGSLPPESLPSRQVISPKLTAFCILHPEPLPHTVPWDWFRVAS